ncbi:MAG: hypothetical protein KatS3mg044_0562 [Rhodothermaceae bacterium]|nr:MAG: hypothetical protein KatS3mg044_0562 [Rhodothermaceae bacterium]
MTNAFPSFPDEASLWVYATERPLTANEQALVLDHLNRFFSGWASHGRPVRGAAQFLHDRFLLVAGHLEEGTISGCGTDACLDQVRAALEHVGTTWVSSLTIFYRDADGHLYGVSRPAFRRLIREGRVDASTPVFDLSLTTVGDLRAGRFERPAGQSWHATVFHLALPA